MKRFNIAQWSIITKFSLMGLLIITAVAGIVIINLLAFSRVKGVLVTMVEQDVPLIVRNAELGRVLSEIFAESRLLLVSFIDRKDTIATSGEELIETLQAQIRRLHPQEEYVQGALESFGESLQNIFDHCLIMNGHFDELQTIEDDLNAKLGRLDTLVVEKSMLAAMEGNSEEAVAIEQLGSMLTGYREIFYQIMIQLVRSKQAHLGTRTVQKEYEQRILILLEELHTGLGATTSAWEDIHPLIAQTMDTVLHYKDTAIALHSDMRVFQSRLGVLEGRQKQVIVSIEMLDVQIARKTEYLGEYIIGNTQKSINMTMLLSGMITCILVLVEIYTIRVIQPLKLLARIADRLSEGDIGYHLGILHRKNSSDEIGTLSKSFTKLINYNQEMADIATAISRGDLSHHIQPRSEQDVLGRAFLDMSAYLNDLALATTAIADGEFSQEMPPKSEQDVLGNAFRTMALHLHESFDTIETQLGKIQQAAEERTHLLDEVQATNEVLRGEVTERKRAEEAAKAADRAKSEFLAEISHELRTPLNIILGMVQAMQGEKEFAPTHREHLNGILQSGNHLLLLVNRLIDASRLEKNRLSFEEQHFDFPQLLQDVQRDEEQQTNALEALSYPNNPDARPILTSDALRGLPSEVCDRLHKAVEVADFEEVMACIQQVHRYNARLADALGTLVDNYRFDLVLELLKEREDAC